MKTARGHIDKKSFGVGTRGFEPPASWSRTMNQPRINNLQTFVSFANDDSQQLVTIGWNRPENTLLVKLGAP